jgi:hypothetical protein
MEYLLTGYRQIATVRRFLFDGVAANRTRLPFTVSIDTALTSKYGIGLQELPLLSRKLLEERATEGGSRTFTFSETDMAAVAAERTAARDAMQPKKFHKKAGRKSAEYNPQAPAWSRPPETL